MGENMCDADEREALRDVIAGWPIGGGYYATQIAVDEAAELADAILAAGYSRTPDAHLAAAKAEEVDDRICDALAAIHNGRYDGAPAEVHLERALRVLREQGGDQ